MLHIGSVVLLSDNKKYVIASKTNMNGNAYCFLVAYDNEKNIKICKETIEGDDCYLDLISPSDITPELLASFGKSIKVYLKNSK